MAVLVRDLMFAGRITAESRAAGVAVRMVREPADLGAVLADLDLRRDTERINELRQEINRHNRAYHELDAPTIPDADSPVGINARSPGSTVTGSAAHRT